MATLDVLTRAGAATLFLATAVSFFLAAQRSGNRGHRQLAVLFFLVALGIVGFLAGNTADSALTIPGLLGAVLSLLSGTVAVFAWWFVLAAFDARWRAAPWHLAVGGAWVALAAGQRGWFGAEVANVETGMVSQIVLLALVAHLGHVLILGDDGDLVPRRRRARRALLSGIVALLLIDVVVDLALSTAFRPASFTLAQNAALLTLAVGFVGLLLRADPSRLAFEPPADGPALGGDERMTRRVTEVMTRDRPYLDAELTLARFAKKAALSEATARRTIRGLGHDHFRSFVNEYRMAAAKAALSDPVRAGEPIGQVAFSCGFGSLATFNRVFKASEGETPTRYKARAISGTTRARASEVPRSGF